MQAHRDELRDRLQKYIAAPRMTGRAPGPSMHRRPSNKLIRQSSWVLREQLILVIMLQRRPDVASRACGISPASPGESGLRRLLLAGAAAGPTFVGLYTVEGRRRTGYDPRQQPISALSLGPGGWKQKLNFYATGLLLTAGAAGLSRAGSRRRSERIGAGLVAAAGLGTIAAGVFNTDPVNGYPPGTPARTGPYRMSRIGILHTISAVPVFLGLPAAALAYAVTFRDDSQTGWSAYSVTTAAGMLGAFTLMMTTGMGAEVEQRTIGGGTWQRTAIVTGYSWVTAMATRKLRNRSV